MKPLVKNLLIAVSGAIIGGASVFAAVKYSPSFQSKAMDAGPRPNQQKDQIFSDILDRQNEIKDRFDSLLDDEFFDTDPFEGMRKMREQMEKQMEEFPMGNKSTINPFDAWYTDRFGGGTIHDISQREDEDFVYYDIKVTDLNQTSINTKVENNYVTITGTVENTHGDENSDSPNRSLFKSTFTRTFPLPGDVDSSKMQMSPEKNKIVLKFPKIKQ